MAEYKAKSLSPTDVQAAIDLCSEGDTAVLPSGEQNDFNTTISVPNGVSIRGQEKASTILRKMYG